MGGAGRGIDTCGRGSMSGDRFVSTEPEEQDLGRILRTSRHLRHRILKYKGVPQEGVQRRGCKLPFRGGTAPEDFLEILQIDKFKPF